MYRAFFVDDEPLVLEVFMNMPAFLECGYINAGYAHNPLEAVDLIKIADPDAVFTDLRMPGKNGIELMRELREDGYDGEFIIVSAYGEFEEARKFFKMDGFDYVVKPVSEYELQSLLIKLSAKIALKRPEPPPLMEQGAASAELNRITEYLQENLEQKHSLEALGEKFHFNPNYICNLFARCLGTTFVTYMRNIRMEKAARLLRSKQKAVKEVAAACGYNDYFYFCRVFREVYSCTPTAYREAEQ